MDKPSISLRAAEPTFNEGLACGRYLDEAAEGFFRFMLGRQYAQIIAKAYSQTNHNYSFKNVTYAEYNQHIVGMALSFSAEQHKHFSEQPLKVAAGYHALRMATVKMLFAPMLRIINTIAEGDFYLLAMAIDKELRGLGIGLALMDSIEEQACAAGSSRLALDVSAKNDGARRLYERRGMSIEWQWPKHLSLPGLRFYRMIKTL